MQQAAAYIAHDQKGDNKDASALIYNRELSSCLSI